MKGAGLAAAAHTDFLAHKRVQLPGGVRLLAQGGDVFPAFFHKPDHIVDRAGNRREVAQRKRGARKIAPGRIAIQARIQHHAQQKFRANFIEGNAPAAFPGHAHQSSAPFPKARRGDFARAGEADFLRVFLQQ